MGAIGQDAAPPAEGNENGGQPTGSDPWESAVQAAPEDRRDILQEAFNPLREQLSPRLELADRLEPLGEYADDLIAMIEDADEEGNTLQDVLGFTALLGAIGDPENPDPQALEEFAGWWEQMGETYGLFDGADGEGGEGSDPDDEDDPTSELSQRLDRLEQENQALRQELGGLHQNDRVARIQQTITSTLDKGLKDNGIKFESEEQAEETKAYILTLAQRYGESAKDEREMVNLGLKDYLKLTGGAQRELLGDRETETVPAGRSPRGGSPDVSPDEITTGDPSETRRRARQAAMSRLTG